jgi:ribosomal protein S27AE
MEFKFCPECGKPVQPALLSTKRQACASCGWTGEVIEQESVILKKQELKPRITLPKKKLIYSSYGEIFTMLIGFPLVGLLIGGILLLIPIIGWIASPIVIFTGFTGAPYFALRSLFIKWGWMKPKINDYKLEGKCPYCDNNLSVNLPSEKTTCGFCKERVLIKAEKFYTIIRKHSE